MEKMTVTCRLDAADVKFLDELAEASDRDRSHLIKQAVASFIDLQRWQLEEIRRAIGEADAGEFASKKEVEEAFGRWTSQN